MYNETKLREVKTMTQPYELDIFEPEVESLLDVLESVPKNQRKVVAILAEVFIKGMQTQSKLTVTSNTSQQRSA